MNPTSYWTRYPIVLKHCRIPSEIRMQIICLSSRENATHCATDSVRQVDMIVPRSMLRTKQTGGLQVPAICPECEKPSVALPNHCSNLPREAAQIASPTYKQDVMNVIQKSLRSSIIHRKRMLAIKLLESRSSMTAYKR